MELSVRHFVIVQSDMMSQFMNDRVVDLLHHFFWTLAKTKDRPTIDGNPWWWFAARSEE